MIKIVLIGGGNVARHLIKVLTETKSIELRQIYNRHLENIKDLEKYSLVTDTISELADADVYIIAVSDTAIHKISQQLNHVNGLVVHTSGTTDMDVIQQSRRGVFYPLQTFTKDRQVCFKEIPICIEANNPQGLELLKTLALSISNHVFEYSSEQRKKIHLAAVVVNNFVNHLYYKGYEFLEKNHINPDILQPLLQETALKLKEKHPFDNQTGPAKRKDLFTVEQHIKLIQDPELKKIYKTLSNSISKTYE